MAASSKFDMSSGSPDRPLYPQRASFTAASLDRLGSFREKMENPILSSLPSMSRSCSAVTQGDVLNFFQCLRFDPKSVAEYKFSRQGDFKRTTSVALGLPLDDSPSGSSKGKLLPSPSPEELKRLKAGLREISSKARERVKIFSEALSVIKKCFPSIPSRKRSRPDFLSTDRSNASLPNDRPVLGTVMGKMGSQSHAIGSAFELEQQKSEERTKIANPNKRTRTSVVDTDTRAITPARASGSMDRDREILRHPNSGAIQGEDRTLTIGVDGWERSKMKKKRSGIKPDVSPSRMTSKPVDGYREPKQGMQPRLFTDARSRLNDSHGFRPGVANGAVGVGKADGTSQQTGLGMRSSIPRADQDNSSHVHDRRDRPTGLDKERMNLRAANKTNIREDFNSASPTSNTKMNATARSPRSGSGVVPKLSLIVQRTTAASDWELSQCTSKLPAAVWANNRKQRTPSTRSSSPPVAHCASQRPQKISRTARRTNFVPVISSNDETSSLDTVSDAAGNENGSGFARNLPSNTPQPVKLKGDHFPMAALSESKESGATETKYRDKIKKSDEMDGKAGQNVQKVSALVLPPRKNKLVSGEELGDGVRRQGRTGRGFTSTRSLMPMTVQKLGNMGTAKQLRSARVSFDKTESKAGRPPTRKLSDRKAYTRQKHTTVSAADFLDDGHEELLAAANAVINPSHGFPSPFWRQMEAFFCYISDGDIAFLKQQGKSVSSVPAPTLVPLYGDSFSTPSNGFRLIESEEAMNGTEGVEPIPEQWTRSPNEIPLCQRLIAALISEEGNEELCCSGNEDLKFDIHGSEFEIDAELESSPLCHRSSRNLHLAGRAAFNGYRITSTGKSLDKLEHIALDNDMTAIPETGILSTSDHLENGLLSDQAVVPGTVCSEFQYDSMTINEKLLLELQSIGLYPEPVPNLTHTGDDEINDDIRRLEDKYQEQVSKKNGLLGKLLKSASETREIQEKEIEQRALDKLLAMAYEKYMTCWGKSVSGKTAKQAALDFVKRTLERCQKFEDTGKSCFSEPLFRDMFLSGFAHLNDAQTAGTAADGESGKQYVNTSGFSAPMGTQQSPSLDNHDNYINNVIASVNPSSEQDIGKEVTWSGRIKKRELLLDDVGTIGSSSAPPVNGRSLSSSAKGKRSERDREVLSRNGTTKVGRPVSCNVKGERKSKTKPKQKTTQLSASVNGLIGKMSDKPKTPLPTVPKSSEMITSGSAKGKDEFGSDVLGDTEGIDLSNLQIPEMDVLGVPDDLGGQGQDIDSWLNMDGLQEHDDYVGGLEIPMDDLSDLHMMV
ncbi:uncharacterized protein LOC132275956 [Cornus florida]|uniref:uncharacterized protein LOC132275956 n=1 Tax=Cornus florida TaxID=4283 RepID=UPI0028A082A7|nr:uncharacterized protein LOC132275956 [Cornus florida]